MPKAQANKVYSTLSRGLITEAGPLNFPENASTDESNCDITTTGSRKRRLGFNLESEFSLSEASVPTITWNTSAITTFNWSTVAGDGNKNFLVVQAGTSILFYDMASSPLSDGAQSFSIDLTSYAAPNATPGTNSVQMASGKGILFIVGEDIESLAVTYASNDITVEEITLRIRDFDGVDDDLDPEEEPVALTDEHSYNLKNQGWLPPNDGGTDPVTTYFTTAAKYPPNSKQWWQGKDSSDNFSAAIMQKFVAGNTLAPRGHYILDAFAQDKETVSGISGLDINITVDGRPRAVAFFAGRAWYAGVEGARVNSNIYFSQILVEDSNNKGFCYQQNDPTSEDLSDLLATDGGIIVIPDVATVVAMFPVQGTLIVLATNGVWGISGTSEGTFKATDFSVYRISSIGISSPNSVVDVDGIPVWWSKTGIVTLTQSEINNKFAVSNLSESTIQTFYDEIPTDSKSNVVGEFDVAKKRVYWLYKSVEGDDSTIDRFKFDSILILDLRLKAFIPWSISTLEEDPYYISSVFSVPFASSTSDTFNVVDSADEVVDIGAEVLVAADQGTIINATGSVHGTGGPTSLFDSDYTQLGTQGMTWENVTQSANLRYIGKDWGAGVTKAITKAVAYSPTDEGFDGTEGTSVTLLLQGSDDNSTWTTLATNVLVSAINQNSTLTSSASSTPYRYHRVAIYSPAAATSNRNLATEIEFYENSVDNIVTNISISSSNDVLTNFLVFKETEVCRWTFGNFTSTSFYDWVDADGTGVSFESYVETGNELLGDVQRDKQAPYIHCFFNKTETAYTDETYTEYVNPSSCFMQARWEWADHYQSGKWSPPIQAYRFVKEYTPTSGTDFDNGFPVVVTKNKVRGTGKTLRLKFTSEEGKDFDMLGWAISYTANTDV